MGGERPGGITILAVLYVIEGLFTLGMGGLTMAGGSLIPVFGGLVAAIGAIYVIVGLIDFAIAYGLWNLKPWARTVAIIFAIIGLLGFPIGTIISIIILWYLFKPEIKEAFGQA
ncbi:MAG TPA: hypothetical protein ENL42_01685 [Thermoplasmatales archaeon]|nr:hypothetical protein [Thermoplasmatales archaeon]